MTTEQPPSPPWEGRVLPSNARRQQDEDRYDRSYDEEAGERTPDGGTLWGLWVLATILGWGVAGACIGAAVKSPADVLQYAFLPLGAIGQWLILRRRFQHASLWLVATLGGTAVAALCFSILLALPESLLGPNNGVFREALSSFTDGVALGVAQWLVLRRTVRGAAWWIAATAVPMWLFGALALVQASEAVDLPSDLSLADRINAGALNLGLMGLFVGVCTGGVLLWLVRRPAGNK